MFPPRPRGRLAPETLKKLRISTVAHCVPGQSWPSAVIWSPDMDAMLLSVLDAGRGIVAAGKAVGVHPDVVKRRFAVLRPGVPVPLGKRGPRRGLSSDYWPSNGEGGTRQRPPIKAVCSEVRSVTAHAPDIGAPEP